MELEAGDAERAWRAAVNAMQPYRDSLGRASMTNQAFCVTAMRR